MTWSDIPVADDDWLIKNARNCSASMSKLHPYGILHGEDMKFYKIGGIL